MDPTNEHAPEVIEQCKRALDRRRIVRPVDLQRVVDFFETNDYAYDVKDNRLHTGFTTASTCSRSSMTART